MLLSEQVTAFTGSATVTVRAFVTIFSPPVSADAAPLSFGSFAVESFAQEVTVSPESEDAASIDIQADANASLSLEVMDESVQMVNESTEILVSSFQLGGTTDSDSDTAVVTTEDSGVIDGVTVGATASIPADPDEGVYEGAFNLRLVYQ